MAEATRAAFGRALVRVGGTEGRIVVLDADLASSTQTKLSAAWNSPIGTLPAAPFASRITVSFVLMSPSTLMRLKE